MASRLSAQFNAPYDPRDYAPGIDTRAAQLQRLRDNAAEDGLASPPPPYTPPGSQPQDARATYGQRSLVERAASSSQSHHAANNFSQRRMPMPNTATANRHSVHMGSYMPPPPNAAPPMPRQRVVSDIQSGYDSSSVSPEVGRPPNARRAASANAGPSRTSEAGPSRSSSRTRTWVPGMPLPGPPPGPPPPTSRSQSTSGAYDRPGHTGGPSQMRNFRQTMHVNDLGPIPPTPSTWTEEQPLPDNNYVPLRIETGQVQSHAQPSPHNAAVRRESNRLRSASNTNMIPSDSSSPAANSPAYLSRSSAVRDSSSKGLRERRANRNSVVLNGDLSALSVQTNPWAEAMSPENSAKRPDGPPFSGGPRSGHMSKALSPLTIVTNTHANISASPVQMTSTPPISPDPVPQQQVQPSIASRTTATPLKSLPTPPSSRQLPLSARSATQTQKEVVSESSGGDLDSFQREAIRRHTEFLEKEKAATSDHERLQLFAEYVLSEATLRQRMYASALSGGDFDVDQFRANLFKPLPPGSRSASNSISHVSAEEHDPTTANTTPQTRPETMWWKDYHPELSPIASMDYDEMSSRGRAPSRWWESSQSGGTGGRQVHRSKRESKYMGLSKEALMASSPSDEAYQQTVTVPDAHGYPNEKANPETFGYYDGDTPRRLPTARMKMPEVPSLLDISRFITLPPPYPRHYPAVNNNHPELAQYRMTVRTLGSLDDIKNRKARYGASTEALRGEHKRKVSDSRRSFRGNVQAQVADGIITFAEAAQAEEAFRMSEFDTEKKHLQTEFDTLQDMVINPLHDMLHERITQLDASITKLQDDLHTDARYQDPDQPQEEGDEKPELLEKLTQLKWLFDVRETIQRECFDLLSVRNDKYKAIVLLPYQYSLNNDKVRDTESFFEKDRQNRFMAYCNESLKRHEDFLQIVEQHVRRGIELQSSAFWDIAPGLVDLLGKIPDDLGQLQGIQIPEKEYEENPSYHQHPQQYLYSLLSHAEKSTYQFIEGQVNLQCLLHEVRTAMLAARYRAVEEDGGKSASPRASEYSDSKAQEEAVLTAELKQKASMIEEQWLEGLGSQLQAKRELVKALLQENDAWEEIAAEDA